MASAPEIPLQLFFEQSSLFCDSVRNDLDRFIGEIENSFSTINRNVKIAPKQRRKSRVIDTPDSCTLDLKEFTKSKQTALNNLQTAFETLELKWSSDIRELKYQFLRTVEDCLSKIQLEIKVSAEDLNLSKTVHEVELHENSSSDSEVDILPDWQNTSRLRAFSPPSSTLYRSGYQQNKDVFHAFSPPAASINTSVSQRNISKLHDTSSPPAVSKSNKKRTTSKAQTGKGTKATRLSKMEIDKEDDSGSDSEIEISSASIYQSGYQQSKSIFHAVSPPPAENIDPSLYQQNTGIPHDTSSPPSVIIKSGKKGTTSRAQARKGTKTTRLSKKEVAKEDSIPISNVREPSMKSKMSDWQSLLSAVENAPCKPGLYEIKVWRAKKPAYIGHSDDIQESISVYREGLPSGEKHLDLFLQRNKEEVSVRYEVYPSVQLAKLEQKKRLKEFMEKYKNLPSYNYGL